VIDDTAVTPRYVTGFTPDRELPVIWRIAKGSMFNKLFLILPVGLLLSYFLPGAITPILMLGGAFLCYEGVEKIVESLQPADDSLEDAIADLSSEEHEKLMVSGAVRTDLILSAEIMAIALGEVAEESIWLQAGILFVVAVAITIGVYGMVGLIVKMDDIGLNMAKRDARSVQAIGRGLVRAMPKLLAALSVIGIAAMIWVGGGIFLHGMHEYHFTPLPEWLDTASHAAGAAIPAASGLVQWVVHAVGSGAFGLVIGGVIVGVHHAWVHRKG
jgi:predicted DNA repair protein MutK